jgi:hypothetical protein
MNKTTQVNRLTSADIKKFQADTSNGAKAMDREVSGQSYCYRRYHSNAEHKIDEPLLKKWLKGI